MIAMLACLNRVDGGASGEHQHRASSRSGAYALIILAPIASTLLALRWFADPAGVQPTTRMAVIGRWRGLSEGEAKAHPLYGTSGIMVSLLIGMLLNVPLRVAEFLAAVPPIPTTAPHWLSILQLAMTFDVVLFTSLYPIAFVAALRRVALFPRMLAAIWILDVTAQLMIAKAVAGTTHLPPAVASALQDLLFGNVQKVLISVCLWLPYLLLSTRVNVTYRHRVPA